VKLFLLLLILTPAICLSQVDSTYIRDYERNLSVSGLITKKFINLSQDIDSKTSKMYLPNNPPTIGLGISLKNTVVSFSYGYGFDFMRDKSKGKTKIDWDIQFHHYNRYFVVDVFYQKYKGFYEDDDANKNYIICPDLKIRKSGVFAQYIFNNKKFSYKSAFNQTQKQIKSAGSWLLGGTVYTTKITSDSSFVYRGKNSFRNFQFGVNVGYAYNWVLGRYWFISGSVSTGIAFGSERFSTFGKDKLEVQPTVFPRMAFGYDRNNWSLGFSYVSDILFHINEDDDAIGIFSGNFEVKFVKRFYLDPFWNKNKK